MIAKEVENTPVPPLFDNPQDMDDYIFAQRAAMIKRREEELRVREKIKDDVRQRLLPKVKKLMAEYKDPHVENKHLYNQQQLNTMEQLSKQISNVSIPEIVIDVVGVRHTKCTEEDMVEHIATRGVKFSDDDIVSLIAIMLDKNLSDGHATELALDILRPYIGKGRVKETTWRDYYIDGEPKTVIEILAGRISRQLGVPHIPLSMTRIPDASIDFPSSHEDIIQLVEEMAEEGEKRPVWGEK